MCEVIKLISWINKEITVLDELLARDNEERELLEVTGAIKGATEVFLRE